MNFLIKKININQFLNIKIKELTLNPFSLRVSANWVLTVDFPTPPFPDSTKIIDFTDSNILVMYEKMQYLLITSLTQR